MRLYIPIYMFLLMYGSSVLATQIAIINNDGPNEGFNDTTVVSPVGGNTGTTLGEQRRIVFESPRSLYQHRLDLWTDHFYRRPR